MNAPDGSQAGLGPADERVLEPELEARADPVLEPVLAQAVQGLSAARKWLPSALFYDDAGTALFQRITELPEYYLTRVEQALLAERADDLAALLAPSAAPLALVELGSGDGSKTAVLAGALLRRHVPLAFFPIDTAQLALEQLVARFARALPAVHVQPVHGDYFAHWPTVPPDHAQAVLMLGSNLGNYNTPEAIGLLAAVRARMRPGGRLVLGLDLKKDPQVIREAYDDRAGVTAAFNLNLLARLNRELGMDFDLAHFRHDPSYSPLDGAARSFLVSTRRQVVHSAVLGRSFTFDAGEMIYTEQSQKYDADLIAQLAAGSGFAVVDEINDARRWYALSVWEA
jgi:dimethylhistidine N-methyltransferase